MVQNKKNTSYTYILEKLTNFNRKQLILKLSVFQHIKDNFLKRFCFLFVNTIYKIKTKLCHSKFNFISPTQKIYYWNIYD